MRHRIVYLLFLVLLISSRRLPAECIEYDQYLHAIGGCTMAGYSGKVAVAGNYAYVADSGFGLQVVDIADPARPHIVGSLATTDPYGVTVSGQMAYVAAGPVGLHIVDISDPLAPRLVTTFNSPGSAQHVAIAGDYAYVADGVSGLWVADISDPQAPHGVAALDTPGSATCVVVSGDFAYVADGTFGLRIINVSNPLAPILAGALNTPGYANSISLAGTHAYVADGESGLRIIDVSDPGHPVQSGSLSVGIAYEVATSGSRAYLLSDTDFIVVDITTPANPAVAGSLRTASTGSGIAIAGETVLLTDTTAGLTTVDVSQVTSPPVIGSLNNGAYLSAVAASGDHVFVTDQLYGMYAIDIADPQEPVVVGQLQLVRPYDLAAAGSYLYVADYLSLRVIDISDPADPRSVATVGLGSSGSPHAVVLVGDLAYVAAGTAGLVLVDIADPLHPTVIGSVNTPGNALGLAVANNLALIADSDGGLQVVDVANPHAPQIIGSVPVFYARAVGVYGSYAFVSGYSGLEIISIADPSAPLPVRELGGLGTVISISIQGSYAYVGGTNLSVLDVSEPEDVRIVGCQGASSSDLVVADGLVHSVDFTDGLKILPSQCETSTAVDPDGASYLSGSLHVHPNPSTGSTSIEFATAKRGAVQGSIYDAAGRRVREMTMGAREPGIHALFWDGRDDDGRTVPSGVYLVQIRTVEGVKNDRVVLMR